MARIALAFVCLFVSGAASAQTAPPRAQWFKGNTHTHTLNSDGDSSPDEVVRWYREHGYAFLVLTDHNVLTPVDNLKAAGQPLLVMKGEEVTEHVTGKPVHLNALDPAALVPPQGGRSIVDVLQRDVDAIRRANGVPHINHPNFGWAVTTDDLARVKNNKLFEIFNGHPQVNNLGGGGVPGLEEIWDALLSRGTLVYGIAVDDAHVFKRPGDPSVPGPGRGWVVVRAARLEPRAIVDALERGDFYASTGVVLDDVRANEASLTVVVKPDEWAKYRVQFIGKGGRVLREIAEPSATYTFAGDEGYVRARVLESNGRVAWIQPVVVRSRASPAGLAVMLGGTMVAIAAIGSRRRRR